MNLTRDETWASRKRDPFRAMAIGLCLEAAFDGRGLRRLEPRRATARHPQQVIVNFHSCAIALHGSPSRLAHITLVVRFTIVRSPFTGKGLFRLFVFLEQLYLTLTSSAQGVCRAAGTVRH
jgi:hypothetical protein